MLQLTRTHIIVYSYSKCSEFNLHLQIFAIPLVHDGLGVTPSLKKEIYYLG